MKNTNNKVVFGFLLLFISAVFVLPFITSCGKTGIVNGATSNTQLAVFNVSPNIGRIDLYADVGSGVVKQDVSPYVYNNPGSYFYINPSDTELQIRTVFVPTKNIITLDTSTHAFSFSSNCKYSLYIAGLASNLAYVFTVDTDPTPSPGFGKLRYVNTTIQQRDLGMDVSANGTPAFSAIKYLHVSKYISLPAGNYNFKINQTGTPAVVFATPSIQSVPIHDGSLYTLYSYGVVGQTDTSAVNAAVFTNR